MRETRLLQVPVNEKIHFVTGDRHFGEDLGETERGINNLENLVFFASLEKKGRSPKMWKEANKNGKGHDQKCCVVARQGTMLCCGWQTGAKLMGLLPEI